MKKTIPVLKAFLILTLLIFLWACSSVPLTGRRQLSMISDESIHALSFQQYDEFLETNPAISGGSDLQMVRRVGQRIQHGVEQYFEEQGLSHLLKNYDWEFNLVENEMINAWCMPGGKVVVYTGLLPVARNEEGLAVVMGHEIAHAVARHGAERMSQQMALQMGGMALSQALAEKPEQTRMLWSTAYGLGTQFGIMLPYSRLHESEADRLGLVFMALAGYNPDAALRFWQDMSQSGGAKPPVFMALAGYNPDAALRFWQDMSQSGGAKPPEFLSTHPSDATRIADIQQWMPEALKYYRPH